MKPYKFVSWDVRPLETLSESRTYKLWEKLENGEKLTRDEKNAAYGLTHDLLGWRFHYSGLKRFIFKKRHYGWIECYAYDKTSVRANNTGVLEIIAA